MKAAELAELELSLYGSHWQVPNIINHFQKTLDLIDTKGLFSYISKFNFLFDKASRFFLVLKIDKLNEQSSVFPSF